MERDFDFAGMVEQYREREQLMDAEAHKYDGLTNKRSIIAGWERYHDLHGAGNPRDGEAAFELLERLYKKLQPFESAIIADHGKAAFCPLPNDDAWIGSAHQICVEYHAQKPIFDVGMSLMGGNASPKSGNFPYLPMAIDTERARKYFTKASKKGWLTITPRGYKWHDIDGRNGHGSKARLAYFLKKIYCANNIDKFPETILSELFGMERLGETCSKLLLNRNNVPRRNEAIDRFFED